MGWFTERRSIEDTTLGLLVTKSAEFLRIVTNERARRYRSVPSISGVLYEVKSIETRHNYIVDLAQQSCTCSIWQLSCYPCGHAISIILDLNEDPQCYVKSFFTIAAYKKTYEQIIFPFDLTHFNGDTLHSLLIAVPDDETSKLKLDDSVLPPSTRHPLRRLKKHKIHGQLNEAQEKHVFKCSRYKAAGHL